MADLWRQASAWSNAQLYNDTSKVMTKGANDAWTVVKGVFSTGEPGDEPRQDSRALKDAGNLSGNDSMGGLSQVLSGPHADVHAPLHGQAQAARPSLKNFDDIGNLMTPKRNLATQEVGVMAYTDEVDDRSHMSTRFEQQSRERGESNRVSNITQHLQPDTPRGLNSMPDSSPREAKDASVITSKTQQPAPESKPHQQDEEKALLQQHGDAYHNSSSETYESAAVVQKTATETDADEEASSSPGAIDPDRLVQLQEDSMLSPSQADSKVNEHRDQNATVRDVADDAVHPTTYAEYSLDDEFTQDNAVTQAVEHAMPIPGQPGRKATREHSQDVEVSDAVETATPSPKHADDEAIDNPAQDVAVTGAVENAMGMQAIHVSPEPTEDTKELGNEKSAELDAQTEDSIPLVVASRTSTSGIEKSDAKCKHKECSKLNVCQYSDKCTHSKCHNRRECKSAAGPTEKPPDRLQCGHEDCKGLAACRITEVDTSAQDKRRSTCGHEQCRYTDLCELLQAETTSQTCAETACGHDECKDSDLCKLVDGHMSFPSTAKPGRVPEQGQVSESSQLIDNNMSASKLKDSAKSSPTTSAGQDLSPVSEKLCKHRECAGRAPCTYNGQCEHIACRNRRGCKQSGANAAQPQTSRPPCGHDECQSLESCLLLKAPTKPKSCKHSECQQLASCQYNAKCAHEGCMNRRECKEADGALAPDVPLRSCNHEECMGMPACLHESSTFRPDATRTRNTQDHLEDQGNEVDRLAQMTTDQQAVEAAENSRDQEMGERHEEHDPERGAEDDAHRANDDSDEGRYTPRKRHSKSREGDSQTDSEAGSDVESSDKNSGEESDSDDDITKHHASRGKNVHFDQAHNKHHSHAESDVSDPTDTESGDETSEEESNEGPSSDSDDGQDNHHESHMKALGKKKQHGKHRSRDSDDETDSNNKSDTDGETSSDDGMGKDHGSRPKAGYLKFPHKKTDHKSSREESDDSSTGDSDDSDAYSNVTSDDSGSSSDDASDLVSELEDEDSELESGVEDETIPMMKESEPLGLGTGFGNSPISMGQIGGDNSRAPHKGLHGSGGIPTSQFPQVQPQAMRSSAAMSLPFAGMTASQSMPGFDMGIPGKHSQAKSTKAGKAIKMPKLPKMESIKPMKPGTLPAIQSGHNPSTSLTQTPHGVKGGGINSFSPPQMPSLQRMQVPPIGFLRPGAMPAMQAPQMSIQHPRPMPALQPMQPLRPGQTTPMQMPGIIPGQMSAQMAANIAAQAQMNQAAMMNAGVANEANAMVMQAEGAVLEMELEEAEMAADVMAAAYGMSGLMPMGMMPMGLAGGAGASKKKSKSAHEKSGKGKKSSSGKVKSKSGSGGGKMTKSKK